MEPRLTHVFTLQLQVSQESVHIGTHPSGSQKHITPLNGGVFRGVPNTRGEGMDATLVPGGSDWVLHDPVADVVQIDVRTQGKLADGSGVSVQYTGYLKVDEKARRFMARGPDAQSTNFEDHDWWVRPVIETGVPRFKWTESKLFVARGRFRVENDQRLVEYQIFEVCV